MWGFYVTKNDTLNVQYSIREFKLNKYISVISIWPLEIISKFKLNKEPEKKQKMIQIFKNFNLQ